MNKTCGFRPLLLLLLAAGPAAAAPVAAELPYVVRHWGLEEGLPQITVNALAQTPDGFLWIGTFGGLIRFDGLSFKILGLKETEFEGLRVVTLHSDREGVLWVGTEGSGLARVSQGVLERVPLSRELDSQTIVAVHRDRSGRLWFVTEMKEVHVLDGASVRRMSVEGVTGIRPRMSELLEDERGEMVVGLAGMGVYRVVAKKLEPLVGAGVEKELTGGLLSDGEGRYLLNTTSGGLQRLAGGRIEALDWSAPEPPESIETMLRERDGTVWMGTPNRLFKLASGRRDPIELGSGFEAHGRVRAMLEDREGSVWVGSHRHGLFQLIRGSVRAVDSKAGLPEESVQAVCGDATGRIFAAMGCLGVVEIEAGVVRTVVSATEIENHCAWSLGLARDGTLWIGTYDGPVYRRTARGVERDVRLPELTEAMAMFEDSAGQMWIGTRSRGIYVFSGAELRHYTEADGLPSNDVRYFAEDSRGRIYFATSRGPGVAEGWALRALGTGEGIPHAPMRGLLVDGERLWLGTYGSGLVVGEGGQFRRLRTEQGLYENVVSWVWQVDGWLWWTGNQGVYGAPKAELLAVAAGKQTTVHPLRFTSDDGMPSSETNGGFQPAGWEAPDGSLWIPTVQGLAILDPRQIQKSVLPPLVHIEKVLVDGREMSETAPISVDPSNRRLEIHYTSASLRAPRRVRFATMLEGLDPDWVQEGSTRVVQYSRLPPGNYKFRVKAVNESGVWSTQEARVSIARRRAFEETWLFRSMLACALILIVAGIFWSRTLNLRTQAERLEQIVERKTSELREANTSLVGANGALETAMAELDKVASLDTLTGAWNRRHVNRVLDAEMKRSRRYGSPLSLLVLDVDNFKDVNDRHGHQTGDVVLAGVAQVILRAIRASDCLARWGGEEFLLLAPETALPEALVLAEKVRRVVNAEEFPGVGSVTVSLGVAQLIPEDEGMEACIARADENLYAAKRGGRNQVYPPASRQSRDVPSPAAGPGPGGDGG